MTARSKTILADGLNWHIVEEGEGPEILLVHGTAASVHSWRKLMPILAQSHRVIALDLPGHGSTQSRGSSDLNLMRMGRGVAAVALALAARPETVAGHSAGAAILAWACAQKLLAPATLVSFNGAFYPFGGVAGSLFSPIAKLIAFNPLMPQLLSRLASKATVERLLRDTGSRPSAEDVDFYYDLLKRPSHVAAALGMMAAWDLRDMDRAFAAIEASCVFVAGANDRAVPPETSARAASHCRLAKVLRFEGYGHLLHEENPSLAADIILGRRT